MDAALQNKAAALGWTQPEIDAINSRVKLDKIGAVGPYPATWMDIGENGGKKRPNPGGGGVNLEFWGDEMMNY